MTTAMSYVSGAATEPLIGETIGQQLDRRVQTHGDRPALIAPAASFPGQSIRWTWRDLAHQADSVAAGLLAMGLVPGDRIGIWSPNNAEWIVTQFAAARAGLILVTINPAYRLSELEYALNKVTCRALVTATEFKTSNYAGMLQTLLPELATSQPGQLQSLRVPSLDLIVQIGPIPIPGAIAFHQLAAQATNESKATLLELRDSLQFDDPICIQFTSGTTGAPKGATLTHHNILNNGFFTAHTMRLTEHDRLCIPVPLYHCFGMVMGVLGCLTHGTAMVLPGEGFDPLATLKTVARERCTALYGVPTMFIAQMDHPEFAQYDISSLRTGIMAGSPCPIEVMKRAMQSMHLKDITIAYGMTETSPVSFQTTLDDPLERRVASVGRIHPHLEAKVIDPDGRILPAGVKGELCTRGYSVMLGYWDEPDLTKQVIDQARWMHTGDLATIDAERYCAIVGRIKDMLIRGGENVYPREVEEFLYRHPAIADVQVFGVADEKFGEEVCAWVQLRPNASLTEAEITAFCRDQIAHYKTPRHIRFVDSFPMTVTGKMQKYLMREAMQKELEKPLPTPMTMS